MAYRSFGALPCCVCRLVVYTQRERKVLQNTVWTRKERRRRGSEILCASCLWWLGQRFGWRGIAVWFCIYIYMSVLVIGPLRRGALMDLVRISRYWDWPRGRQTVRQVFTSCCTIQSVIGFGGPTAAISSDTDSHDVGQPPLFAICNSSCGSCRRATATYEASLECCNWLLCSSNLPALKLQWMASANAFNIVDIQFIMSGILHILLGILFA